MAIFKGISKISGLILQIVLVIAAVLVFSYFDPFELLAPTKKTLKDTPIQVKSIKEIGQIITAEYYGEVLTSLEEVLEQDIIDTIESFNYEIHALHLNFISVIDELAAKDLKKQEVYSAFTENHSDITEHTLFRQYTYFIDRKIKDRSYNERRITEKITDEDLKKLIEKLGARNKQKPRQELHAIGLDEIQTAFESAVERQINKKKKHSRLVLLGRGWVKAGFDFNDFSEKNFIYDKKRNRAIFLGMNPKILSAAINPWFIPEKGVEGFEFVVVERRVRHKPELTLMVKERCLEKLINQATDKDLLTKAQTNAEKNLKDFFSILIEDDDFQGVFFFTDYLDYSREMLLEDGSIRNEELLSIDTILNTNRLREGSDYPSDNYRDFLDSIKMKDAIIFEQKLVYHSRTSTLFKVVKDRKIDLSDTIHVCHLSTPNAIDSIWLKSYPESADLSDLPPVEAFYSDLDQLISQLNIEISDSSLFKREW